MELEVIKKIKAGGVGVIATDTLYGVVGRALDRTVVERIYQIKGRSPAKPLIVLISDYTDLNQLGITLTEPLKRQLEQIWPGAVSVILPCPAERLAHLHRGTQTLALRLPAKQSLRLLLTQTGPLVAPSANPEGELPAQSIVQAREYFGTSLDFYKTGHVTGRPSKLIQLNNGRVTVLRG